MAAARVRLALGLATGLHAVALIALGLLPSARAPSPPATTDDAIAVDEEPLPTEPVPAAPADTDRGSAVATASPRVGARRASVEPIGAAPPAPRPVPSSEPGAPPPAASAEPWSFPRQAPMDLGIGSYWKSYAAGGAAAASGSAEAARPGDFSQRLREDARAGDVASGLGVSGPLLAAARDAAGPSVAPETGAALIELDADADGKLVAARVLDASTDRAGWSEVATRMVALMASRRLHLPATAHGLRARVRIVAELARPAGENTTVSPGAVPDDAPASDRVCERAGNSRKCVAGMPLGASGSWGDLSNIGARRSRVVHVALVSEALL